MTPVRYLATAVSAVVLGALAACGSPGGSGTATPAAAEQQVQIAANEYAFQIYNAPLHAGWTSIIMLNGGSAPHQAQIVKPKPGVTAQQFITALQHDGGAGSSLGMVDFEGGANTIAPAASETIDANLSAGDHVIVCFVRTADGTPHFEQGMIATLHVGAGAGGIAPPPASVGTIGLRDFSFAFPTGFTGHGTYEVKNAGPQPHEMTLLKLAAGATTDSVKAFLSAPPGSAPSGPPPFTSVGGMGALAQGASGFVHLNLAAGSYVAACFVPDQTTHAPHFEEGMIQGFTIA